MTTCVLEDSCCTIASWTLILSFPAGKFALPGTIILVVTILTWNQLAWWCASVAILLMLMMTVSVLEALLTTSLLTISVISIRMRGVRLADFIFVAI